VECHLVTAIPTLARMPGSTSTKASDTIQEPACIRTVPANTAQHCSGSRAQIWQDTVTALTAISTFAVIRYAKRPVWFVVMGRIHKRSGKGIAGATIGVAVGAVIAITLPAAVVVAVAVVGAAVGVL